MENVNLSIDYLLNDFNKADNENSKKMIAEDLKSMYYCFENEITEDRKAIIKEIAKKYKKSY